MTPDPYEAGPPEYQPDEEPGADDRALFQEAAIEFESWACSCQHLETAHDDGFGCVEPNCSCIAGWRFSRD